MKQILRQLKGVGIPCKKCKGIGTVLYGSGATWRGGMGTASFVHDVCDSCWGSGDADRQWTDIRKIEEDRRHATYAAGINWIKHQSGASYSTQAAAWTEIIRVLEKQGRRRRLPEGLSAFWYARALEPLVSLFKRLHATAERATEKES